MDIPPKQSLDGHPRKRLEALWWAGCGTPVPFPRVEPCINFVGEQFWGRAAPGVRRLARVGAPVLFWDETCCVLCDAELQRRYFPIHSAWPITRPCIACSTSCMLAPGLRSSFPLSA